MLPVEQDVVASLNNTTTATVSPTTTSPSTEVQPLNSIKFKHPTELISLNQIHVFGHDTLNCIVLWQRLRRMDSTSR